MILYLISLGFLIIGFKSTNPITSALCLILGLVTVASILIIVAYEWYVYLVLLLFLSGVIVMVVYFSSLSTFVFKLVKCTNLLFFLVVFCPFALEFEVTTNIISFFFNYGWYILLYLLSKLVGLMLVSSYLFHQSSAIRRL